MSFSLLPFRRLIPARALTLASALTAASAFAQTATFSVVNTGLETQFSNAGKGIFDPQVSGITGVAFGSGLFVVIGASGNENTLRWATSPDGTIWTARSQPLGGDLKTYSQSRVHFLNGKFLFFAEHTGTGGGGFAYSSADGLTWTRSNVINTGRTLIVEFDASPTLTVAASTNGAQYASADLMTWTSRPVVASASGFDHNDLAYGTGRFYSSINGFGGTTYSSTDAVTWTSISSASVPGGGRVESGNGVTLLVAGSNFFRSTDGTTFTRITPTIPAGFLGLGGDPHFIGGRFVSQSTELTTANGIRTGYLGSSDGLTWSLIGYLPASPPPTPVNGVSRLWIYSDIAFGNGKYVQVANDSQQTVSTRALLPLIMTIDASAAPPPPTPPAITAQPVATAAVVGRSATLSVAATGTGNTYQWRFNNNPIAGATASTYTIASVSAASAGNYSVFITNSAGNATSATVALTLVTAEKAGRLINLSVLTDIATATDEFTLGYVVGGAGTNGTKPLVIRAAGPSLGALGVGGTLSDPKLETFAGATKTGENDNWGGSAQLTTDLAAVGAFAYTGPTSRDSAVSTGISTRDNSVRVTGVGGATGQVIAEVYDATNASAFVATTPRLLNVSVRKELGSGLTAGFVLGGTTPTRVLIRVVGPGLAAFGVGGTVADPQLVLFNSSSAKIGENNDWGGATELTAAFTSVGAFALPAATSKDAALLLSLPPGGYSVQASGVSNTTGIALVEVYEVP